MYRLCILAFAVLLVTAVVRPAAAASYVLEDGQSVIGEVRTVTTRWEETLLDVARRSGVGFEEIVRANPDISIWLPGEGTEVVVPTRFVLPDVPHRGVVINLPEYRLYYFPERRDGEPQRVITYPVAIGRMDWDTPLGLHRITEKRTNPTWHPPQSVREDRAAQGRPVPSVVPPGPDNPLGSRAMRLTLPSYLIHGTNRPAGVGMRVTAGCIRMYPDDVEALYDMVDVGTEVRIINQPLKVGWHEDVMFLQAHRPLEEYAEEFAARRLTVLTEQVVSATRRQAAVIDWTSAESIARDAQGIPAAIATADESADEVSEIEIEVAAAADR